MALIGYHSLMLQIRKKLQNVFKHFDTDLGDFLLSKGYFKIDKGIFQIIEDGGARRMLYSLSEITIYDDTASGFPETFLTDVALYNRLFELGYNLIDYNGVNPSTPTVYATESPIDAPFTGSNTFELPLNYILISVFLDVDLRIKAEYIRTPTGIIILDTLVDGNIISIRGFIASGSVVGGSVNSVTDDDNGVVSVNNSNPANPIIKFNGVYVDGTTVTGNGTEENPLTVIGGGGGADPSLITKFTSNPIPSIVGTDILVPEDETWLIDSVPYTNPTVSTIPFSYAPDGLLYFLTVVATKFNTFIGKFGTASTDPSEPTINNDELFLTTYLISDGTIEVVIPPVNPNIYVEKESFAPLTLISSGHIASIELDKRNNIILSGTITKTGNVIKNNSNYFVVGLPFMTTNRTSNAIEIEHMNTSGGSGSVAYFNPEELSYFLQPNEVAIWISEILNGQKIHRRVSSYIDRDNVIYRSGTGVGKDIVGDLKFSNNAGLITEEFGGLQSKIYERNGKWNIEVLSSIDTPTFEFDAEKGFFADKLFDIDNDENAYLQKGHIVQLEEDIFNLELNKADLVGGLVPSSQLPAYVDDVLELANLASFPVTGEVGKIYLALDSNKQYRWSGSSYIQITNGLIASTNDVPEGSNNLYFTTARVLATLLSGISLVTGGSIVSTDSVLVAFGKIQKQINDIGTALGLKQDTLNEDNFGTFTNSVTDKNTQSDTDVLAYVDITTGKWVKQTFSKLVDYLKGFFQPKIKVIYIGSDTTLSDIHNGCVLIVTDFVVLTIPAGLGATFTSCVIDVKVGKCTIGTAAGVTATGYYSLILATGDTTSIIKESDGTNNFRIK